MAMVMTFKVYLFQKKQDQDKEAVWGMLFRSKN